MNNYLTKHALCSRICIVHYIYSAYYDAIVSSAERSRDGAKCRRQKDELQNIHNETGRSHQFCVCSPFMLIFGIESTKGGEMLACLSFCLDDDNRSSSVVLSMVLRSRSFLAGFIVLRQIETTASLSLFVALMLVLVLLLVNVAIMTGGEQQEHHHREACGRMDG